MIGHDYCEKCQREAELAECQCPLLDEDELDDKFGIIRPDEVAECWEGVSAVPGLYQALWDLVPLYTAPRPEVSEEPCYGMDCVAQFWGKLSREHQTALVRLEQENA